MKSDDTHGHYCGHASAQTTSEYQSENRCMIARSLNELYCTSALLYGNSPKRFSEGAATAAFSVSSLNEANVTDRINDMYL